MTFEELRSKVLDWAEARNILKEQTLEGACKKFSEEANETIFAVASFSRSESDHDLMKVIDGIGDTLVTVIVLAELVKFDPIDCLDAAYDEIKDRTGTMKNGVFVKDEAS